MEYIFSTEMEETALVGAAGGRDYSQTLRVTVDKKFHRWKTIWANKDKKRLLVKSTSYNLGR